MVARRAHNPKVVGSNPAPATNSDIYIDPIRSKTEGFVGFFVLGNAVSPAKACDSPRPLQVKATEFHSHYQLMR